MEIVARQGDLLLVKSPAGTQPATQLVKPEQGRLILLRGEATGHHHSMEAGAAEFRSFVADDRPSILEGLIIGTLDVKQPTDLVHIGHHDPIPVAPGLYFVVQQREYRRDEIRRVMD